MVAGLGRGALSANDTPPGPLPPSDNGSSKDDRSIPGVAPSNATRPVDRAHWGMLALAWLVYSGFGIISSSLPA